MTIDNEPLRRAVLHAIENGATWDGICRSLGWTRANHQRYGYVQGDSARLKRTLGLLPKYKGEKVYHQTKVTYDLALRIATVIHVDPNEVGL